MNCRGLCLSSSRLIYEQKNIDAAQLFLPG